MSIRRAAARTSGPRPAVLLDRHRSRQVQPCRPPRRHFAIYSVQGRPITAREVGAFFWARPCRGRGAPHACASEARSAGCPEPHAKTPAQIRDEPFLCHRRAALSELGLSKKHVQGRRKNNRVESSHVPIRRREGKAQGFKSPGSTQRFLPTHAAVYNTFNTCRPHARRNSGDEIANVSGQPFAPSGCLLPQVADSSLARS